MRRTLSIIGGLALGLVLSQFPEYAQQYTQRLGGAVDELRVIAAEFEQAATEAGISRDDALDRYQAVADPFIQGRGLSMRDTIRRFETLSATLAEIQGASGWERFASLPLDLADASIAEAAERLGLRRILSIDADFDIYRDTRGRPLVNLLRS